MLPNELPYRPCVGIALFDHAGQVFLGKRKGGKNLEADAGNWQMPQGGIDRDEDPAVAARRELQEETNVRKVTPLAHTQGWLRYELPPMLLGKALKGRYRGQEQLWFAFRVDDKSEIDLSAVGVHPEFTDWRFASLDEAVELIVDFKRPIYQAVRELFQPIAKGQSPQPGTTFTAHGDVSAIWSSP